MSLLPAGNLEKRVVEMCAMIISSCGCWKVKGYGCV